MQFNSCEFYKIRYNLSHILLKIVNEMLTVFYMFPVCLQFIKKDVHEVLLSILKFLKTA